MHAQMALVSGPATCYVRALRGELGRAETDRAVLGVNGNVRRSELRSFDRLLGLGRAAKSQPSTRSQALDLPQPDSVLPPIAFA